MKERIVIGIFCLLAGIATVRCQQYSFALNFVDSQGNTDQIIVGLDSGATYQIDTELGEVNIIDQLYQEGLDVRITDELTNRLQGGVGTYHTRRQIIADPTGIMMIDVVSENFPITISWDRTDLDNDFFRSSLLTGTPPGGWWDVGNPAHLDRVNLFEQDSVIVNSNAGPPYNENYAYVEGDTVAVYWFAFFDNISINVFNLREYEIIAYPNPTSNLVTFTGSANDFEYLEIISITGDKIAELNMSSEISIEILEPGLYLLRFINADKSWVITKMIAKI